VSAAGQARPFERVAVVGGGSWGTALALVARRAGREVRLLARDAESVEALSLRGENPAYLPGIALGGPLAATTDPAEALRDADAVLLVTPAQTTRAMAGLIAAHVAPGTPLVLCASGLLLSEVVGEAAPACVPAVLSGPSFAADVARGLPTAVTLAAEDGELADRLSATLASSQFRPYAATDLVGVQIGGALKNVLAIACGAVAGKGWGASALAALTARGFAELARLGEALGARPETLTGLSGLGDLVLTCSSAQSRNFAFGMALGAGEDPAAAGGKLAEGVHTASVAVAFATRHGVEVPISAAVADVLAQRISLDGALASLMGRPLRREA
jgi:glycerol-3-phosphate dehydrogenase (NAD(P)+)